MNVHEEAIQLRSLLQQRPGERFATSAASLLELRRLGLLLRETVLRWKGLR